MSMIASELFATSQGCKCDGEFECHWCGGRCTRKWIHDDAPPIPFVRSITTAIRPGNAFVCTGCWLYRRPRVTVQHLDGTQKDGQSLTKHSWWITPKDAWIIEKEDHEKLYSYLLSPPSIFSLSLLSTGKVANLIQLAVVNRNDLMLADTLLYFTLDNIRHSYTVYELEEGLRHGLNGKMPGVRALIEKLGSFLLPSIEEVKRERGRPLKNYDATNKSKRVLK